MRTQLKKNVWDAVKAVFRRKFTALNAYNGKEERCKIKNLSFHFRKLEKEEHVKSKYADEKK